MELAGYRSFTLRKVVMESSFVGAYWSSRKETREECAKRIAMFLESIADRPSFRRWFLKKRSRKATSLPLEISVPAIGEELRTNNRDIDGAAILELGFNLNVWNGNENAPASFAVTCGAFSRQVKNSAVLYLPKQESIDATFYQEITLLLKKAIQAWEPENAVVTSAEYLSKSGGGMPWVVGGWLSYQRETGIVQARPLR